MRRLMKLAESD